MPEEAESAAGTLQPPPASQPPRDAGDGTSGLNPWLLVALLVVAVLISIQNLWLRRRGQREDETGSEP